jgi:hypothetical protein
VRRADDDRLGRHHDGEEPLAQAEADEDARRVGGELDAGAGRGERLRLIEKRDAKAVPCERERCRQPADAGARDDDRAFTAQAAAGS